MPPKGWKKTYRGARPYKSPWATKHGPFLRAVMHRVSEMGYDTTFEWDLQPEHPLRVDVVAHPRGTTWKCGGGRRFRFSCPPEAVFEVKVKCPTAAELDRIVQYGEATNAKRRVLVVPAELRNEHDERTCDLLDIVYWTPSLPPERYAVYDFATREQKFLAQLKAVA